MFDKIQNNLLLNYPLLWNMRIVPVLAVTVALHVLFFIAGYISGTIHFTDTSFWNYDSGSAVMVFFAITLAILVTVIWLVFYFRNNAYKSFYPQNRFSLFKEWLLILMVCLLNCAYSASYNYAEDLRKRSYFNEQEFSRRIDIISMASLFVDGGYKGGENYYETVNGRRITMQRDSIEYNNRKYALNSLLNKTITDYPYQNRKHDSLNEVRVKRWLVENKKDSVKWVMNEFLKITESHKLKSNITADKWFDLVYDYPEFISKIKIGRIESYDEDEARYVFHNSSNNYDFSYDVEETYLPDNPKAHQYDTISNTTKVIGNTTHIYPKYYVPLLQVNKAYNKMSSAYTNPAINAEVLLFYFYFAFCMSFAIFSFRVTSGRSWLIALVALGITAIVTGLFSIVASSGSFYLLLWGIIICLLIIYFYSNAYSSLSKGNSAVVLNVCLWLIPWLIPAIYGSITSFYNHHLYYHKRSALVNWLEDNVILIMYVNFTLLIVYMYFFTQTIKRWKGKPED